MAEKKSWRDYTKDNSTEESTKETTTSKKTGSWRDYTNLTGSGKTSGGWRDYRTVDPTSIVGENVVNQVNSWLQNHNSYITEYQKRYEGRKYSYEDAYVGDSADWLNTAKQKKSTYDAEADAIISYLYQNRDYLDASWMQQIKSTITKARDTQNQLIISAQKDNDYWAKFTPNEDQAAAGYTAEKLYNEWQAGQKQYATDQTYDVDAGMLELEELKKEREAYLVEQEEKRKQAQENESWMDKIGRWLGTTPDTSLPLGGASAGSSSQSSTKYDSQISALEEQIERAKYVQGYEGFMDNMDAEDYAANSRYASTRTDVAMEDAMWGFGKTQYDTSKLFGDFMYDYINRNEDALNAGMVNDTATDAYFLGFDKGFLKTMTDDEIGVYNYLYKTQGQEAANAFLSHIESDLEGRRRAQEQAFWASYAKSDPVGSSVFSTLISPLKGMSYLGQAADMLDDGKMEENAGYNRFSYIPSTIRSQVSTTIEKSGKWGKVGSFAYNTGMSMADFLFTTAVSGGNQALSLSIMGSGAAADATLAAKDRGLDDAQAFTLGTIAGLAEVAMEKISLGAWLEGDMTEGALRYMLKNALSEGGEEAGTSVINLLADVIIAGDKSEWNMAMQAYIDQGKSEAEAFGLVLAENAAQIGLDALGGALSGSAIGGGTYAGASIGAGFQYGDIGKDKAQAQQLVTEGLELNPTGQYVQKAQSKLDKGKNLTGMQVRNILAANKEQVTANDMKKIQKAAEKRFTDLGQTKDVSELAEIATKWATGQEITRAEKKLLTHSEYGSRVANELLPENIASEDFSTEWAEEIGTKQVNKAAYNKKAIRNLLEAMASTEDPNSYKSLESRMEDETPAKVSDTGKAVIQGTNEEIDLKSIKVKEISEDSVVLDVNGKDVDISDVDFATEDQWNMFNALKKIEHITPGVASAMVAKVDMAKPIWSQMNGMDEAYTYGFYGYSEADLKAGLFTGNITKEQLNDAYKLGQYAREKSATAKADAYKQMRTVAQAQAEKEAKAEGKKTASKTKNLTITYNKGNGEVVSIDEAGITDAKQSGAVEVAKILHQLGLGTRVEFFSSHLSETLTDKKGNPARVFLNDQGVEQRAYSGVYRKSDGTIRVDLNAYNGRGLTLNALSHELTHFIQQWSDQKYQVLVDFLMKEYEKTDMTMHERVLREQKRLENIRGEEVSYDEAYDEVVANAMSKMFDDGKLVEKLTQLKEQDMTLAQKLWEGFKKILAKFMGIYEKEGALFQDAADLMEMKETFEQLQNMFAEALVEASENFQAAQEIGFEMDMETESVSPAVMHSEHTWTESDYVQQRDKAAQEIAKAIGVSEKKAKDYIDSVNSIAKMIAEDRSRLDYFSSPGRSSFVSNAEYGGSFDFSTLCKKRRLLTGTFTAIQKALPNTALTANEILDIRNRMKEKGLEVSCGLCYVEGSRANMGQFAKEFLRLYKQYYPDAWQPNMADVNTPDGIEWVRINHPECYEQYEYFWNHYGTLKEGDKNLFASQQKPKLYQLHTEYKGEILKEFKNDDKVEDKNMNGGIRLQSFSDFEIVHLIDTMQIIMDMSRVGLAGQAYTKVPDFAWALGDTGLKINLSLIAKGVDANGKLIFDDVEGMPIADAMKLRDRYSKNVGTILVAFNDEQLLAAMADERVDFIIPFHRSQWKKSQYEAMGLPAKTKDYTFMQNEKFIKPTYHEYRGRMVKDKATNYMPNEYWDFSKTGKENAEAYLEMCARNNKRPKFYKFLQNNGDGSYSLKEDGSTDGYWKLLIDFKMYDNDGNGSPQMPVKPDFNMEEATRMLNDYSGGHSNFPVAQGIVDGFVKDYKASHKGEQYSSQETDIDTDAVSAYDGVGLNDIKDVVRKGIGIKWNNGNTIKLERKEYAAVTSRISTQYKRRENHGGVLCIERSTDGEDAKFFLYLFVDHGFDNYEIIARLDYAKQYELIHELRRMIQNGRKTERVSTGSGGLRSFHGNSDRSGNSNPNGSIKNADDEKNSRSRGQRSKDNGLSGAADSNRSHERSNSTGKLGQEMHSDHETDEVTVYHGSKNNFEEFDFSRLKDELGVFFSKNEGGASQYGNATAYTLSPKKTLVVHQGEEYRRIMLTGETDAEKRARFLKEGYDTIKLVYSKPGGGETVEWVALTTDVIKKQGQEGVQYSEHETDYSNRSLLANAFEGITQNSVEYKMIQEYKSHIAELNSLENKLSEFNREIHKIRFGSEGKYDAEKLRRLETEAKKIAEAINRHDRKLVSLEASAPLRRLIERERKKEAQKTKAHVQEIQQNKKVRAEQTELRHKIRKAIRDLDKILNRGNKKQNVKEDMKGFVSKALELADYLFTDHISNDDLIRKGITVRMTPKEAALVKETEDILSQLYDHADSLTDEEFTKLDAKRKTNEDKLRDLLTAQRNERLNTPVYNLFNDLVTEYAKLQNSNQDAVKGAYDPKVEEFLRSYIGETTDGTDSDRKTQLQNMRVGDMTTEELWKLHNAYTMVLHSVRQANSLFVKGKTESIEQMAGRIMGDFTKRKTPDGKVATVIRNLSNKMGWDYEKLHYALDRIGSEAFTELVMNIADSENIVMQDIMEAVAFRDEMIKKYGFNNWAVNKEIDREFLDNTGKKFKLTLGQLMALYAYSRREGAWDHIEYGGFVFGEAALTNPKPADSYKLSKAQCEAITGLLTKEQKGYAEDMQKFLSETMGEKGNEVSMLLYGIKMFGEKNYFPIHIAGQFKAQANESQAKAAAGFSSMSNAGFTHAQNPNAKAPFVLEGFNEIWADHVNEMSRYHGTVPALEDMRRVMNRSFYSESGAESMAIKQMMENAFGKEAVEYFNNLYKEANSGAITDKLQKKSHKLLSLFRKNSVAYSLSVLIQQSASMVRAYAMINRKYFGLKGFGTITSGVAKAVSDKWTKAHTNAYNEMLKYAPGVTMAKEIGGFDTHTGGSIRSYLLDTNKKFSQKWKTGTVVEKGKAILDKVDNNAIANLPNFADKIAWIEIWNACKREAVAKHKDLAPNSEEFMQAVGERFTEVIRATQVYDSMFAKSPMLKSKNLAVQYLVSFMNEPNTTANMVEKAVRDATRGDWKGGVKTAAVVIHSIIFTNLLKSIIYAMRDDDEDETYIEKYIEAVAGNIMDDFNAFNYIPIARDVVSLAQGYDVERADMAIVADALDAINSVIKNATTDTDDMTEEQLVEFDKKVTEANWKLVESLASFFGIPVKNIRREIDGVIDHARIAHANAGQTTALSAWDKVSDAVIDSIPFMQSKNTKQDKLYDAIVSGDKEYLARLKSTYKTDSAYQSAVRKALRENDFRIHDAAQARYEGKTEEYKRIFREIQNEGKFSFDDIMSAINTELSKLEPDKVASEYSARGFVEAIAMGNTSEANAMRDDIIATHIANGKTQDEAEAAFASAVSTGIHNAYFSGLLDEAGAEKMLTEYAGKDEEEAASKVAYWAFCDEHPGYDFSESNVNDYLEFAEPAGISLDVYEQFIKGTKGLETIKDEWGDVEVTKREQVLEVIDSLPLSWQQKDALYLAYGYAESQIWDVPW